MSPPEPRLRPGLGPAPVAAVVTASRQAAPSTPSSRIRVRISASLWGSCRQYTGRAGKGPSGGFRHDRVDLARQRGDVLLPGFLHVLAVLLGQLRGGLVARRLTRLREQDQRRRIGRLRRERQIKEDERVGIVVVD